MNRRHARLIAATTIAACLAVTSCSVESNGSGVWPKTDKQPLRTPDAPPPPSAKPGEPAAKPAVVTQPDACQELALGPWADVPHGPDPIGKVRDGIVPSIPDGSPHRAPDKLQEFPTLNSYRDPSTLQDPAMVHEAMERAGFERGIDARWGDDRAFTAITVIQYRDAAGAKDALTAHLTDLCTRAVQATVRADRAGLTLRRDSEAVRTLFVMDDIEVSVFTCGCYWPDIEHRERGITDWALGVQEALSGPEQDTRDG